jgi:hypothetical protein
MLQQFSVLGRTVLQVYLRTRGEAPRDTVGPSDYIPWHYTSVRARLATRDAKGFSRTVQLYPLASRETSSLQWRSIPAYRFTLFLFGESAWCMT